MGRRYWLNRLRDAKPISRPGNEIATNWVKREP
jgi:hypothetical protein